MNAFKRTVAKETMYTYVSYFGTLAPDNDAQIDQLCELTTELESFEEWLDQYGLMAYPNVAADAIAELAKCRQKEDEGAIEYYNRVRALLKICDRTKSSYVYDFMGGLKNQEVKKAMALGNYGNETLNMRDIALHAQAAEQRTTVLKNIIKSKNVSSISTVKSERRGSGGEGAGAFKKERIRPTVNAVQCSEPTVTHWKYKRWSMKECLDYFQTKVPPGTMTGRCMGCLAKGHKWDGNFGSCVTKKCPFCETSFFGKSGHAAPECGKVPCNKNAIALAVDKKT